MRSWQHSGFSVDQSVFLPAGDQQGIERLVRYMTRCPFSLSRLVKATDTGQLVYKAEKQACRAFPDPRSRGLESGAKRNFQILPPLDFLAEFTQHIPPKGAHLIRYYGHYSNKSRGMRKKATAEQAEPSAKPSDADDASTPPPARCSKTWAMLIKRVYEVTHFRGHAHLRGHLLILSDACRHGDGRRETPARPIVCGARGRQLRP
ncbi:MAG: transposase [Planctomycetes bacterium]|nr:transposase [Planctomycetota bacterium]